MVASGEMARVARRLLLLPLASFAVMVAAGYFPTRSLSGSSGTTAMIAAQAVVVTIVYATLLPAMGRMVGADARGRFRVALKAGAIRLMLTLAVISVIAWRGSVEPAAFLTWVAIAYVVMIQVETLALVHWNKRLENQP